MKLGIERVLKEKFGDTLKEIRQIYDEQTSETTVEVITSCIIQRLEILCLIYFIWNLDYCVLQAVNRHLDILRPAIKNFGGTVDVIAVDGGDCTVKYKGPETIGSGIKAAIKEKFPDITNVVFMA